jgi:hypothetical protein
LNKKRRSKTRDKEAEKMQRRQRNCSNYRVLYLLPLHTHAKSCGTCMSYTTTRAEHIQKKYINNRKAKAGN